MSDNIQSSLPNTVLTPQLAPLMGQLVYAKNTWSKYQSGWNLFAEYEAASNTTFTWPISNDVMRGFASYCILKRNLKPSSINSYISSIVCLHKLKGFVDYTAKDELVSSLLRGAGNLLMSSEAPPTNRRRVITLPLLKHIGHKLAKSGWSRNTQQTIWACCLTAFFGSAQMGELLPESEHAFDPTSTLTWANVQFREDGSILLFLQMPKSGASEGEYIDIFEFPGTCCPVKALTAQFHMQREAGFGRLSDPVFTFQSGKFLTPNKLNSILRTLLDDMVDYKKDTISGHSFRAGIPSTLARFPDLANSEDIKSWGRWTSSCYETYSRLKLDQKRKIFKKISSCLIQSVPSQTTL